MDSKRHACLAAFLLVAAARGADRHAVSVQSLTFDVDYTLNEDAQPVDAVQVWLTADEGRTWVRHGDDEDRQSPAAIHTQAEGLFGIYFRVTNPAGTSGEVPVAGTEPHVWVFVDATPPLIQLHEVRRSTVLGRRVVQLRWSAIDDHLPSRPIEFEYREDSTGKWQPAVGDPLPNTGRYDWRVPEGMSGRVTVRLAVRDRGGHRVTTDARTLDLTVPSPPTTGIGVAQRVADRSSPDSGRLTSAKNRALDLYREAFALRDRGDLRGGIARMREAVKLDPLLPEGFVELGSMLYGLGDFDRALTAYEIALKQQPMMRPALQGAAKVFRQKKDYASAAKRLRAILRYNPNDAEAWMNLGDIGIFQGDELLARECYVRATQIDENAADVIQKARERLALMAEVSRSYQRRD